MIATLKSHSTGNYLTFITEDEVTESTGAGYAIIHTGYNRCDAFYGSEHLTDSQKYEFTSFVDASYIKGTCTRCDKVSILKEIAPLFVCNGYSVPEDGGDGIAIGYTINVEAVKEYKEITGKSLKYGVFAALKDKLGDSYIFDEDGNAVANSVVAEVSGNNYVAVEF